MDPLYAELDRRAARDGLRGRVRVAQRWTGSPMRAVAAELPERGEILDLGCGFGLFDAVLALGAPGRRVTGRDVDEAKVARARRLFGDLARFEVRGVGEEEAEAWDAVVFYDVLHHLGTAENWYMDRLGLAHEPAWEMKDTLGRVLLVRQHLFDVLPELVGDERVAEWNGELWSPRKLIRRALWHELLHARDVKRIRGRILAAKAGA